MRRGLLTIALLCVAATWIAAEGFGEPNFFYAPAAFGMLLPDDTEESEDEGTTYFVSEDASMGVIIGEAEKPFKNADLLNDKKFTAALTELGATSIKLWSSVPEGDLVWNSATVEMEWDDGSVDQGYMLIVNSKAAKNRSFIVGIFVPELVTDDWENPAVIAMETFTYAKAPK